MSDYMNPAIRADVPPSMHPDIVSQYEAVLEVPGTIGTGATVLARNAFAAMYKFYSDVEDAEMALQRQAPSAGLAGAQPKGSVRLDGGALRRFHGREAELADAAERGFERASAAVDSQRAHLQGLRGELETKIASALDYSRGRSGEGLAISQEIRRHVKGLKPGERLTFLSKAVDAGDLQTVAAILAAPAYISGIDTDTLDNIRALAANRWAKVEGDQLKAINGLIGNLEQAGAACLEHLVKVRRHKETPAAVANSRLAALAG